MYRITVTSESVRNARGIPHTIAEADVAARSRATIDRWHVHAKCPQRAWESFEINWSQDQECLLQLLGKVSMQMGRNDEYTIEEAMRRRGAYHPGLEVTVGSGVRGKDIVAQLQLNRLADERNVYLAQWLVHGQPQLPPRRIGYAPVCFDLWALIMRSSLILAVEKYAPQRGLGVLHV